MMMMMMSVPHTTRRFVSIEREGPLSRASRRSLASLSRVASGGSLAPLTTDAFGSSQTSL